MVVRGLEHISSPSGETEATGVVQSGEDRSTSVYSYLLGGYSEEGAVVFVVTHPLTVHL